MNDWWTYLSFVLGACFALALQWVSYKLAVKKEKEKEIWIRILNSYQDFYQNCMQILNLIEQYKHNGWPLKKEAQPFINAARKAAYDAVYFDNSQKSEQMISIINRVALLAHSLDDPDEEILAQINAYRNIKL